jgi:hypothetical protein
MKVDATAALLDANVTCIWRSKIDATRALRRHRKMAKIDATAALALKRTH